MKNFIWIKYNLKNPFIIYEMKILDLDMLLHNIWFMLSISFAPCMNDSGWIRIMSCLLGQASLQRRLRLLLLVLLDRYAIHVEEYFVEAFVQYFGWQVSAGSARARGVHATRSGLPAEASSYAVCQIKVGAVCHSIKPAHLGRVVHVIDGHIAVAEHWEAAPKLHVKRVFLLQSPAASISFGL